MRPFFCVIVPNRWPPGLFAAFRITESYHTEGLPKWQVRLSLRDGVHGYPLRRLLSHAPAE